MFAISSALHVRMRKAHWLNYHQSERQHIAALWSPGRLRSILVGVMTLPMRKFPGRTQQPHKEGHVAYVENLFLSCILLTTES
ncbi:hypothetical protein K503DRAFT_337813 [Rhizopogon vinicolor AM-OR11-026]|uniref:Uncharacterized protein n=1 Tax=Rhizopogon vinicolor AM-OR11-026 TaxID=1314800 RepID=A0A1B7MTN0_9AGAM|nr:hypothetical protein K503DRAFT_337813 [Rhizopogon vinicolor AM-OR11-026]